MAYRVSRAFLRALALFVALSVFIRQPLPAFAQPAEELLNSLPANLNLGSTRKTVVAPDSLTGSVTIINGNREKQVVAGTALTPGPAVQ